jgi:hypothetical protein
MAQRVFTHGRRLHPANTHGKYHHEHRIAVFVSNLDDDLGARAMRKALLADARRREGSLVLGGIRSLKLKAVGIAGDAVALPTSRY